MKGFCYELLCWTDSPSLFTSFSAVSELLGEAQLRSGREGAEHMMLLCQNGNRARFARIPNGIFRYLKSISVHHKWI